MSTSLVKAAPANLPAAPLSTAAEVRKTLNALHDNCLVLTPTIVIDHIPAMHKVSLGVVLLDENDVYGGGSSRPPWLKEGERSIGKTGLLKIYQAAGGSMIESERIDDRKNPFICEWRMVGELVQLDGKIIRTIATRRLDFTDGSKDLKGFKDNQISESRKNVEGLTEAKCLTKLIRVSVALQQKYTVPEISRPIIIPKLVPDLDTSDPMIRQMVAAKALGLQFQLYGGGQALPAPAEPERVTVTAPDEDDHDPKTGEVYEDKGGTAARDDDYGDVPAATETEVHVCECPCGHQVQIPPQNAAASIEIVGGKRCPTCFPRKRFDYEAHKNLPNLGLFKKYPDGLTPAQAHEYAKMARGEK